MKRKILICLMGLQAVATVAMADESPAQQITAVGS